MFIEGGLRQKLQFGRVIRWANCKLTTKSACLEKVRDKISTTEFKHIKEENKHAPLYQKLYLLLKKEFGS